MLKELDEGLLLLVVMVEYKILTGQQVDTLMIVAVEKVLVMVLKTVVLLRCSLGGDSGPSCRIFSFNF